MKKGKIVLIVAAAAGIIALPAILRSRSKTEEAVPPVVQVITPENGSIELYRSVVGTVEPSDVVYVYPKAAGELEEIFVKTGDVVEAGQALCTIDTKQVDVARLNMEAAWTAHQDAQTNLRRMEVLFAAGDISSQAMEQAQTGAKNAQIQYESAKLNYDYQMEFSHVTATIGGVIESFNFELYDNVAPGQLLCVISGEGSRAVTFSVPEKIVRQLSVGDEIVIEKNGSEYNGSISEISSMIDSETGLFKVKATVADGETLPTGSTAKLLVTADKAEQVMTLPVDAVYYSGGKPYVYTYDNGIVHQIPVEVGIYDSERIHIQSGLEKDSQVINTWSSELFEGSVVRLAE